ncbi:carbohydrate ABC transporter membrane protein 2 (CUT1 family) [Halanaerobium saccharolyticum]|uniref:Carbohydrate ABC transporter membrane protein 2 (CUT1 family) n=1 Tax=Halanaerobium saccharolyticum TaxID=43595 RepID=A0A4R6LLD4_9FIRM|nr:carbohydrate ABC transporter permease [Halanaerobium saccharolyticum]TDO83360.1 carbohydrate ABC transporter membrane protein 2 (CUT1 family) [Halanaerobium saccharolyticum]
MVKQNTILKKVIFIILLFLLLSFVLMPFITMLSSSFKPDREQGAFPPTILPDDPTIAHYKGVLNPEIFPFLMYFKNSLIVAFLSAGIGVVISIFGSYSFARLEYTGRAVIQRGVLLVYMFGGVLLVIPLFQMVTKLGLFDTRTSLIITYIVQTLPVSLYMLGNYFRTIPESIEEAAIIDGCSRLEVIYRIVIPLSTPAIVSVFIYAFMIAWNEYLFASVFINSSSLRTLPIGLNQLFYTQHYIWGRMMAASILTAIPVIILFLSIERFITSGLTFGGVKE